MADEGVLTSRPPATPLEGCLVQLLGAGKTGLSVQWSREEQDTSHGVKLPGHLHVQAM